MLVTGTNNKYEQNVYLLKKSLLIKFFAHKTKMEYIELVYVNIRK